MGRLKLIVISLLVSASAHAAETVKVIDYGSAYKSEFTKMVKTGTCTIFESPQGDIQKGLTHGCKDAKTAIQSNNRKALRKALKKTIQ